MNKKCNSSFSLIVGGKDEQDQKKYLLFNQPWIFRRDEFEDLCEHFQLSRSEVFDLCLERIRHRAMVSDEAAGVFAIMEGRSNASDILAKMRRMSFMPGTSEQQAPPQSTESGDIDPA
ncbi:hypothetical protein [Nitrosomonas mobilis]|jgi:hypothetical protein|uniref:Uncharacterized protein n=1 Tax=Nitrosomonas mobilis TaxID=51642 RepID=A0A1G5SCT0_9PROT|nr:hypothetical protein [Nitrosomonas mobilis]SCZ85006.1 conserved hypothetical protein [Nitrosomonas mobilis]